MIHNRQEAALMLADRLEKYKGEPGVVLAIPRGGVPVAAPIAKRLGMPLEVILSKKVGHPSNPEFAIGYVSLESVSVDERAKVPQDYLETEIARVRQKLQEKYELYMGNRKHEDLKGKVAIIVDDGIATGKTLMGTIDLVKKQGPKRIVVAVPVAPPAAVDQISEVVDELVCYLVPPNFQAVGQFYEEFYQVSDELVINMLQEQDQKR